MKIDETAVRYRSITVSGVDIFYREAGRPGAPVIVLLHGFPSSSRMYGPLFPFLAADYHCIAPDYPGFGHSSCPSPQEFEYSFDNIAQSIDSLLGVLGVSKYTLFVQDYGGPVGFRIALAHPERVQGFVVQNAVVHEEGLGPLWEPRRAFWRDRAAHEATIRANFLSPEATKLRHIGRSPNIDLYNPDLWTDEIAFLAQPGQVDIQTELFYDYRTNVARYPEWQRYLRRHQPPMHVLWGTYDPSFDVSGAHAFVRDVPHAKLSLLEAGHFAMDEALESVASGTLELLVRVG